ncbi:MAG: anthranilate phosphoribosyltransferase [Hyphomicrobiaceae bacterium]|nr:anthranilate phosphoribosyltransferase [Hyphomicrobiaceae bacterium]
MSTFKHLLQRVADGHALTRGEAVEAFEVLMTGEATPSQMGAFLMALRMRGETVDEIAGAVSVMRAKMTRVEAPEDAIDIVGTGGDGKGTYNVSTASAFVVAGAGVPVAKHGNRALSSRSGAADVLAALGVKLDLEPARISACIREAGVGFMFAPAHHAAMRHVGPTRVEMGVRTIFNLLGPLSNPAGVTRQLVGVFDARWVVPIAEALASLGCERALVVHGDDGMDEITLCAETTAAELKNGAVMLTTIRPEDYGFERAADSALVGGDAEVNAKALASVLDGVASAYRDTVLLNAGAALMVAGKAASLDEGIALARTSIADGKARAALDRLVAVSNA